MPFIIERVELQGFLGHRDRTTLSLGPGVYALVGENGAGKSSIVDALRAALTLPRGLKVRDAEVVNSSSTRAIVEVSLVNPSTGERLYVHVEKPRGRPISVVAELRGANGRSRATKVDEARRLIAEALGLPGGDPSILSLTSIIMQGGLPLIIERLSSSPSQRRVFIEEILGVKDYARAVERLKGLPLDEGEGVRLNKEAPEDVRRRLEATGRELERLRGEKRRLEGELSSLEEALSGLEAEIAGLTRYRGEAEELRIEASRLEAEASQLRESLSRALERLKSLEERARQLEELRRECGRLEGLAALRGPLEELRSGQERLNPLRAEIQRLEGLLADARQLGELESKAREYQEVTKAIEEANEKRASLERRLAEARERLRVAREARERLSRRLESLLSALKGLAHWEGQLEPGEAARLARGILEDIEGRLLELRGSRESLLAEAKQFEAIAADLEEKAGILRSARGGRCPLCGSPLPEAKARELAASYSSQAEEMRRRARELLSRARELEARIRELEGARERIARELALLEEAAANTPKDDPAELEAQVSKLEEELRMVEDTLEELSSRREELREYYGKYHGVVRRLEAEGVRDPAELESRLAQLKEEAENLEAKLSEIKSRILESTGARRLEEAEASIERAEKALRECTRRLGEAEEAARNLEAARREYESLKRRLARVEELLEKARGRLEDLEGKLRRLEELEARREELLSRKARLEGGLQQLSERLRELESKIERLEALHWLAVKGKTLIEILERAPPLVLEAQLAMLSNYVSEALSRFGLDIVSASFNLSPEGVELVLTRSDGRRASVGELSGGEKMALALSFIIGLGRLHAIRSGFLVLDEPTAELDEERRRGLVDVLRRVAGGDSGIPQLIIVTHDEDVASSADEVCRVARVAGTSRVTCGV